MIHLHKFGISFACRENAFEMRGVCLALAWMSLQLVPKGSLLKRLLGNSLVVQWLGFCVLPAEGPSSNPGQGTKIRQAARPKINEIKLNEIK